MHNLELIDLKAVFYSAQIILFAFVQPNEWQDQTVVFFCEN